MCHCYKWSPVDERLGKNTKIALEDLIILRILHGTASSRLEETPKVCVYVFRKKVAHLSTPRALFTYAYIESQRKKPEPFVRFKFIELK